MARTRRQIEESLVRSILTTTNDVDVQKGPIYDIFIRPQSVVINEQEIRIDDLSRRYSLDYILTQNTEAIDLYGANHGLRRNFGVPSKGSVTFYTYTRLGSGEVITIPQGTVVSTVDPTISYQTTRDVQILGDNAETFYNAAFRRYEVQAPIESLGNGSVFEVPPNRIIRIQTRIDGIDGVINRTRTRTSSPQETNESFGRGIRLKFNGTAQGSGDGLKQIVRNFDRGRIRDDVVIFSSDQELFRRPTRRAAWDVYIIGEDADSSMELFVGDGVTTSFKLSSTPVIGITSVTINGISSTFSFNKDTTPNFGTSYRANDRIEFAVAPAAGSQIEVTYTFNKLIRDVQEYVERISINLYESDTLVREAIPIRTKIKVQIQVLSSFDSTQAASSTFSIINQFANPERFVDVLYPDRLRSEISGRIGGISNVRIIEFNRADFGVLPIEAIEYKINEYPTTEDSLIEVEVVS